MRYISCCWPSCPNAGMQPFRYAPSGHCCYIDQQRSTGDILQGHLLRYQLHSMLRRGCHQTLSQVSPAGLSRVQCRSGSPPPNQSGRRTWRSSWPPSRSDYPSNASFQGLQALSQLLAPSFWPHRRSAVTLSSCLAANIAGKGNLAARRQRRPCARCCAVAPPVLHAAGRGVAGGPAAPQPALQYAPRQVLDSARHPNDAFSCIF